jgi:hypothetical protein
VPQIHHMCGNFATGRLLVRLSSLLLRENNVDYAKHSTNSVI